MSEEILNQYENFESYWDLVNEIDALCNEAIEEGLLYADDVMSALDRVKMHWFEEHLEIRFNLKHEKDEEE